MNDTTVTEDEVQEVEKELLDEITKNLEENKMTMDDAQQTAKDFLALLPIQDKKDLLEKLRLFAKGHTLGQGVFLKYAKPQEEKERVEKLHAMATHIKVGNIDQALQIAKGEIYGI